MAFSTVAKIGAGTQLFFEDPAEPGVWLLLDNALTVGQVGEQGEFVEITPISKKVREYIRGLETPPQKTMTFNDIPAEPNYKKFLEVWDDKQNVDQINVRVDYSNGRRVEFVLVANGRVIDDPQGATQLQMICFAQQSGGSNWGEY